MKQALVNLLLYAPVAFAVAETYLAFKLYDPSMPFIRLTELEEGLERRGLLSDAAVGLLAHLVVWLSSEPPVRVTAKLFYAWFLVNLWYAAPGQRRAARASGYERSRADRAHRPSRTQPIRRLVLRVSQRGGGVSAAKRLLGDTRPDPRPAPGPGGARREGGLVSSYINTK